MVSWVTRAKELLAVLDEHPTVAVQTSDVRDRFREILEGAAKETYLVRHYREPRAVLMNVEAFEAVRRLALLLSGLVQQQEALDRTEGPVEDTTVSGDEWKREVDETIRSVRRESRAKNRFKKRAVGV